MTMWRCDLYADILEKIPCVTMRIKAETEDQAKVFLAKEMSNIQVRLRAGELTEDKDSLIVFAEGEQVRSTRFIPNQ